MHLYLCRFFGIADSTFCEYVCLGFDILTHTPTMVDMIYAILQTAGWIVSIAVIVVCYIWILVLYKKGILHSSGEQGHRISLMIAILPALMPFVMHIQSFPSLLYHIRHTGVIANIHQQLLFIVAPYILADLSGLVYPIFLLYLNSKVGNCWKKMLQACIGTVLEFGFTSLACCLHCCSKVSLHCQGQVVPAENSAQTEEALQPTTSIQIVKHTRPTESSQHICRNTR